MKKFLVVIACSLVTIVAAAMFAACGGSSADPVDPNDKTTLRMEAEYIELVDEDGNELQGGGWSNEASGYDLVYGEGASEDAKQNWSNGYFLCETHREGLVLEFVFESNMDTTARIYWAVGNQITGSITLTPDVFSVELNDEEINYSATQVTGYEISEMEFTRKQITSKAVNIKKGTNVIKLTVKSNTFKTGATGGPMIDYVQVKAEDKSAVLSWQPHTENTEDHGDF